MKTKTLNLNQIEGLHENMLYIFVKCIEKLFVMYSDLFINSPNIDSQLDLTRPPGIKTTAEAYKEPTELIVKGMQDWLTSQLTKYQLIFMCFFLSSVYLLFAYRHYPNISW